MASLLSSTSPFSAHQDVLSANPSTPSEIQCLVEELKRRGRVSVTSKRWPEARELYTKAIDVLLLSPENDDDGGQKINKELSVVYSNRSLCQLQMNYTKEAYEDAQSSTIRDESYVKSWFRLGQACVACGGLSKLKEGLSGYEKALELQEKDGSSNKALRKEIEKVKKMVEEEKKREEEEKKRKEEEEKEGKDEKKTIKPPTPILTTGSKVTPMSTDAASTIKTDGEEFTKSEHVRGYKIVGGRKTSYFHHEQTEEEKRLIGDIAPKRINADDTTNNTNNSTNADSDTSAWNKAGTWEEKTHTPWAIASLEKTLLDKCTYNLPPSSPDPNGVVRLEKITKLQNTTTSHASVASVRGKKRYIFEFVICLHWTYTFGSTRPDSMEDDDECVTMKGTMTLDGVDGTHELGDGYDVADFAVQDDKGSSNKNKRGDAKFLVERFVRDGGWKEVVEKTLDEWIITFRETY